MAVYSFCLESGTRGFDSRLLHMAKLKETERESFADFLRRTRENFHKTHKLIDERWSVVEVTPSWEDNGYWGNRYYPEERKVVTPHFPSEQDCHDWIAKHNTDKGNRFEIKHEFLREHVVRQWWSM